MENQNQQRVFTAVHLERTEEFFSDILCAISRIFLDAILLITMLSVSTFTYLRTLFNVPEIVL